MNYDKLRDILENVLQDFPTVSVHDTFVSGGRKHVSVDVGKSSYPTFDPVAIEKTAKDGNNSVSEEIRWQISKNQRQ